MSRAGAVLYWVLAAVPVVVVLFVPQLVLQDGGLHLASASAFEGLLSGRWPELLSWRPGLPPNLLVELLLLGLLQLVDPNWALRIVTVLALGGFAAAGAVLARVVRAPMGSAILLLPFAMNFPLLLGLLGFACAVPLALLVVAVALRRPESPPQWPVALLLLVTWFTHLVPALAAVLALCCVAFCAHLSGNPGRGVRRVARAVAGASRALAVPVLPTLALSGVFLVSSGTGGFDNRGTGLVLAAKEVVGMTLPTVAYVRAEYWIVRGLALALYTAAAVVLVGRLRRRRDSFAGLHGVDGLLVAAGVVGVASILVPEGVSSGAVFLATRLSLLGPLLLVGWLMAQAGDGVGRALVTATRAHAPIESWRAHRAAVAIAVVATVGLTVARLPALLDLGRDLSALRTIGPCLPRGATLVQLNLDVGAGRSVRMVPMAEQSGAIAAERDGLDLGNESGWLPYYLWRFDDRARADRVLVTQPGGVDLVPPRVDLEGGLRRGLPLQAVVVFGRGAAGSGILNDPRTRELYDDLTRTFHLVATSERDVAELWLRRDLASTCGRVEP